MRSNTTGAAWWGSLADRLPHLHAIAPGLLAGLGYNGRGIAMATTLGRLLARLATGIAADEIGYPVTELQPLTLHRSPGSGRAPPCNI